MWVTKLMSKRGRSATSTSSVKDAVKNLRAYLKTIDSVPQEELQKSAEKILSEAIARVPYQTGKLERAIYVRVSKDKRRGGLVAGASARASNGYNYAGIQHENENFNHPIKGEAHFISGPFNEEVENLKARLRKRLTYKT